MKIDLFSGWNKIWTTVILASRTPYSVQVAASFSQACVEVSPGRYSKSDPYVGSLLDPAEEIRCDFPNLGIASDVGPDNSNHPYRSPVGTGNVAYTYFVLRSTLHVVATCLQAHDARQTWRTLILILLLRSSFLRWRSFYHTSTTYILWQRLCGNFPNKVLPRELKVDSSNGSKILGIF